MEVLETASKRFRNIPQATLQRTPLPADGASGDSRATAVARTPIAGLQGGDAAYAHREPRAITARCWEHKVPWHAWLFTRCVPTNTLLLTPTETSAIA